MPRHEETYLQFYERAGTHLPRHIDLPLRREHPVPSLGMCAALLLM